MSNCCWEKEQNSKENASGLAEDEATGGGGKNRWRKREAGVELEKKIEMLK